MLVLTRKEQEVIRIGNDIRVTVVRIGGTQCKIGIEAPRGVLILRGEVANKEAADGAADGKPQAG